MRSIWCLTILSHLSKLRQKKTLGKTHLVTWYRAEKRHRLESLKQQHTTAAIFYYLRRCLNKDVTRSFNIKNKIKKPQPVLRKAHPFNAFCHKQFKSMAFKLSNCSRSTLSMSSTWHQRYGDPAVRSSCKERQKKKTEKLQRHKSQHHQSNYGGSHKVKTVKKNEP